MNRCKFNKILYISIIIFLCTSCSTTIDGQEMEKRSLEIREEDIERQTDKITNYSYQVERYNLVEADAWYGSNQVKEVIEYVTPVLLLEIPNNEKKEKRINKILIENYLKTLPDVKKKDWWERVQLKITYRSEKYLGFEYISCGALPEGYKPENLKFTLDLEQEKLIDYPEISRLENEFYPYYIFGTLYKEMEEYQQKAIEEQSLLRGKRTYDVREVLRECNEVCYLCVEISGLEDMEKEKQINQILEEPLQVLITNKGWDGSEKQREELFSNLQIYIAYKSEQWLSVVYSFRVAKDWSKFGDGIADVGVTVNIETGERYMLNNLLEIDGLIEWLCVNNLYSEKYNSLQVCCLTERELIDSNEMEEGFLAVYDYMKELNSFYMYEGRLVILTGDGRADREIPLPEIYEYLKVDPWY